MNKWLRCTVKILAKQMLSARTKSVNAIESYGAPSLEKKVVYASFDEEKRHFVNQDSDFQPGYQGTNKGPWSPRKEKQSWKDQDGPWRDRDRKWHQQDHARPDERYNQQSSNPCMPPQKFDAPHNQTSVSDPASSKLKEILN